MLKKYSISTFLQSVYLKTQTFFKIAKWDEITLCQSVDGRKHL